MLLSVLLAVLFRFFCFSPAVGDALLAVLVRVAFFLPLTTGWLFGCGSSHHWLFGCGSVSASSPASLCGSLRFRGSLLLPPTPLLSILRDCCFAVGALIPRTGSLQQRVLLTMRIGFSFARYFFFTCSAEMSASLFTGGVHSHSEGFHRGLRLGTTIAYQISSPASLCRSVHIRSHYGQVLLLVLLCLLRCCAMALLRCCVSCTAVRASPHL